MPSLTDIAFEKRQLLSTDNASSEQIDDQGSHPQQRQGRRTNVIFLIIILSLATACIALLIIVFQQRSTFRNTFGCAPDQAGRETIHTHGVEPPILGPEFQKRTVLFERDETFMGRAKDAYPAWHNILHRARHGRVAFDSRPGEFYGVAGYHQLHCVWLMQQAVTGADLGHRPDELQLDHMYHCVEYLRQSVMCYADPTLERRFEGILGPFSANNTHVCGNWDALMNWADEHIYTGPYLNPTTKLPP